MFENKYDMDKYPPMDSDITNVTSVGYDSLQLHHDDGFLELYKDDVIAFAKFLGITQDDIDGGLSVSGEVAPWKDFNGDDIHEGNIISHPSGQRGIVMFMPERESPSDQWVVDYGDGILSRLCLQIGDKGQAIVFVPVK